MEFSLPSYRKMLEQIKEQGYQGTSYENIRAEEKQFVLRHDVDMSLEYCRPVAKIEAEMGLQSTFFVLLRSELYNPFSKSFEESAKEILNLGHQIGLHFDASLYSEAEFDKMAERECAILEGIIRSKVGMISFHRPVEKLLGDPSNVANRMHTYQPRFFSEIGYCSDSTGAWRYGTPFEQEFFANQTAFQLLTHPIWWAQSGETANEKLHGFLALHDETTQIALEANCKSFSRGTEGG